MPVLTKSKVWLYESGGLTDTAACIIKDRNGKWADEFAHLNETRDKILPLINTACVKKFGDKYRTDVCLAMGARFAVITFVPSNFTQLEPKHLKEIETFIKSFVANNNSRLAKTSITAISTFKKSNHKCAPTQEEQPDQKMNLK